MGKISYAIKAGQSAAQFATTVKTAHSNATAAKTAFSTLSAAAAAATPNTTGTGTGTSRRDQMGQMGRSAGRLAFREGASTGKTMGQTWLHAFELIPRLAYRALQLILALVAIGFFGHRVDLYRRQQQQQQQHDHYQDTTTTTIIIAVPQSIAALIIAALSALSALSLALAASAAAIPVIGPRFALFKTHRLFAWDASLSLSWLVVFGVFFGYFMPAAAAARNSNTNNTNTDDTNTKFMKTAAWFDLANAIVWLLSATYGFLKTVIGRKFDSTSDRIGNKIFAKGSSGSGGGNEYAMNKYPASV